MREAPGDTGGETLRVATLNVHGWRDAEGDENHERVVALIREHALDIIGLQEVMTPAVGEGAGRSTALAWVAEALGFHHSGALRRGCGLLSRFPIERCTNLPSRAGGRGHELKRLLACEVVAPGLAAPLRLLVVHLDHMDGERRLFQLGLALDEGVFGARPQLLLGDCNALCPDDYDSARWAEITAQRARSRWEPPRGDTVAALEGAGFVDCWRRAGREGPVGTCRFDTRVDYIWADPTLLERWALTRCRRLDRDYFASDHRPVAARFERVADVSARGRGRARRPARRGG